MPIAETFSFEVPLPGVVNKVLQDIARLDTMVRDLLLRQILFHVPGLSN
jgi:hypothetical protein